MQAATSSADQKIRPENNMLDLISMLVGKCVHNAENQTVPKFISLAVNDILYCFN